jgi:hypothetical protein
MSTITGHCLCGGVKFEIDRAKLGDAGYCHCTRCQRRTGTAASAQVSVEPGGVHFLEGKERVKAYQPENGWAKLFCADCGSALFSRPPEAREPTAVRLGALDPGHGIRPTHRKRVETAADWEPLPDDGLPRYEGPRAS